jgi:hypothetical protein
MTPKWFVPTSSYKPVLLKAEYGCFTYFDLTTKFNIGLPFSVFGKPELASEYSSLSLAGLQLNSYR